MPEIITSLLQRRPEPQVSAPPPEPSAADTVGLFDENGAQLFDTARPLKATVVPSAKIMEHPLESGATVSDHLVLLPVEIEIVVLLNTEDYQDVYARLREFFGSSRLLTVQTKSGVYSNMLLYELPHEETAENIDSIRVSLRLRETIKANTTFQALNSAKVENPKSTSTVKRGTQAPKSESVSAGAGSQTPVKKSSAAFKLFYGGGL